MAEQLLNLQQVSKYYTGNQSVVVGLNSISLSLSRGEFVAVTGESGSGKSTLSHVIGGILAYESGEMYFNGKETSHYDSLDWERYRRDNISFISQNYGILPGATVMKNVISALILTGMDKTEAKTAAEKILRQVELWDLRRRRAAKLSSGQKQRLSIARALAKPAPILIADEPTGNLDPENSAKVISLLAQAADDRLVILITHEFDEAKDLATRHIVLQDGHIASDTVLRPANEPEPAPTAAKSRKRVLSPYVACLQASSRPIWTALMTLFFAMTAFAVFAFLGVFIISLDDTPTRIYDDSAFLNGSTERIAVMKGDTGRFTEDDLDAILALPNVTAIERNGYVTDAQYAYREGTDYLASYTASTQVVGTGLEQHDVHFIQVTYQMDSGSPFIQTVPLLHDGVAFLTDGRLPENFYEVVSADPNLKTGDTVMLFLSDRKNWLIGEKVRTEMTVVGTTDIGSGLYFHDDVGYLIRAGATISDENRYMYMPVNDIDDGTFKGNSVTFASDRPSYSFSEELPMKYSSEAYKVYRNLTKDNPSGVYTYTDDDGVEHNVTISLEFRESFFIPDSAVESDAEADEDDSMYSAGGRILLLQNGGNTNDVPEPVEGGERITSYEPRKLVQVSYNNFYKLTDMSMSDQISITIDRYSYTDRVISALRELGYTAVSPYRLGSTEQDPNLAAERTQTLRVCLIALVAVIALQTVLLRSMFGMQTESYRLLKNIGLTGIVAKLSIVWQVIAFTVAGQLLGGLGIWICAQAGVERIAEILSYLPPIYVMLLSGVHFATSALSTVWIIAALKRQVYPFAGKFEDIVLDDGERGSEL